MGMKLTGRSSLELWSWVFGDESCYEMKFIWTFFGLTAYDGIRVFFGGAKRSRNPVERDALTVSWMERIGKGQPKGRSYQRRLLGGSNMF